LSAGDLPAYLANAGFELQSCGEHARQNGISIQETKLLSTVTQIAVASRS
jgi:hypothetical protein